MDVTAEFRRLSILATDLHAARRGDPTRTGPVCEIIDELEVLHMHADSPAVKASCGALLREHKDTSQPMSAAHG